MKHNKDDKANASKSSNAPSPAGQLKSSCLSLEQRLMFDAAAAATAAEVAGEAVAQKQADAAVSEDASAETAAPESGDGHELVQALTEFMPAKSPTEIVFVDPTVPDYASLLGGMDPHIEVIMLNGGQDGITQMANALSGRTGIDAIHIISHGEAGTLHLGTGTLTAETMSGRYAEQMATIQQALSEQADILVYGCDFAAGETGQLAVDRLAQLTGADVEASSDLTGHASLGGDWDLEVRTGAIETRIAIDVQEQTDWVGLLAPPTLDATKSPTMSSVLEDAGAPSGSVGTLVSSLVDFATPAGQVDNVTDADSGAQLGIAITAANTTNGTWFYSTNGSTWNALGAVSDGSARLLAADATTRIYFRANANYNGTMSDAITFHAWDQTSGVNGGTGNLFTSSTALDQFNTVSYANNDGTVKWGGSWQEIGEKDGTGSGMVVVNSYAGLAGNSLQIETDFLSMGASRQVDLSTASSATLSFDYIRQHGGGTKGVVSVDVYNGKAWTTLQTFAIDATDAKPQSVKIDISAYANANTQIRFIVSGSDSMGRLHVDNIQVAATEIGGGATAYSHTGDTAALTVTAVNDAPTDLALSANTVTENAANGTVVGTITAVDVDAGDTKTYSFTDNAGGRFAINSSTGVITVANGTLLNYEAATSHNVTVRVTDAGGLTYDETFAVAVTNVNEAPVAVDDRAGLRFDGVDDFVDMGSGAVYEVTDTVTMEAWINREPSSQASQIIINKEGEYEVGLDADGSLKWAFANTTPGWAWHDTGVVIPEHTWTHIAVTYDHGTVTSYVDGVAVEVFAGSGTIGDAHPTKDTLRIGSRENNPANQYFVGQISEVQVWNVARTSGEIAADRSGALNGSEAGLLGYWKFNENSGATADNVTANSDGILGGAAPAQSPQWSTYRVSEDNTLTVTGPGVLANDADPEGNALSAIMVTGPSHATSFTLNADGSFSYRPAADFSGTDSFTYRVSDGTNLSNIATVNILVDPVNDAPTDLSLSANTVAENAANGTVVGTITGVDPDAGDTKTYSFTDSAGGRFAINGSTGVITVADGTLLNYEAATSHNVTVRVTDAAGLTYDETFGITVSNVNETPTDLALSANTVAENAANGTVVGTVTGTDPDAGDTKSYTFTDNAGGRFAINGSTGVITVANGTLLNYEAATSHNVTVRVTDAGGLTYDETFTINLTDVNDAPTGTDATVTISEDTSHTLTTANFGFSDADAGDSFSAVRIDTLPTAGTLRLSGVAVTAGQVISVADVTAGNLLFTPAANANGTGYAQFTFSVRDSVNAYDPTPNTLTVNVTAVNDAPTDLALSANTVAENAANGTVVGTVTGTDPDASDTKAYTFTDSAGGRFAINGSTGVITVANGTLLNYEVATSHNVTVRVTDAAGLTYDETFTINLTDVNEAAPIITSNGGGATASISVVENTSAVTTVTATDADTRQTLTYSLSGGVDASKFTIDSNTGALRFTTAPNFEAPTDSGTNNVYNVTVQVSDGNGGIDTQAIAVTVTNVNEAPTDLSLSANTVAENAANGTVVGTIIGVDPDAGDTKAYTFTNSAGGRFAINRTTGVITVANSTLLNYEAATSHSVTVRITDRAGATYDETFTINVTNVNEAPAGTNTTVTINEDTSLTVTAANFGFSDVDAGDSFSAVRIDTLPTAGTLRLSGVAVTAGQVVAIADVTAGNLVFTPVANANGTGYARFTFSVRDSFNAYDPTPNTLTVNVTAVNDAPTDLNLSANTVAENAANGTVVGTITAVDVDAGDTKAYSLTNNAGGRFAINSATGVITVANSTLLNYEAATSHSVTVRITDRAGATYDETFTINVTNVNEAPAGTNSTVTINEDTTHTLTAANFGFSDVDAGDSFSAVRIDTLPTAGTLRLSGVAVTAGQVISVADVTAGNLVFTPVANANGTGYARFTFSVRDSFNAYDPTPNTLTVNVTAVNDAPTDL
ncbi:MAG: cadherin domain-containing protein, partial [Nitrospira sp.]|nr:cadherin domain-containing protein [Nitrospira sp.]